MSMQIAIQLNNLAAVFLESKLFSDAIQRSCAAIRMFQQHQHTADEVSLQSDSSIDQFILDHDHKRSSDDTMNEFIFEHGIILPADTPVDRSVIFLVFMFNCALSHQLAARSCYDDVTSRNYLNIAKRLYHLAFDLQDQQHVKNQIFKFAIVNNIGVIYKMLGNYQESKHCFQNLVSLMMVYVDARVESKRLQYIEGFWKNVLLENGSIAPAA